MWTAIRLLVGLLQEAFLQLHALTVGYDPKLVHHGNSQYWHREASAPPESATETEDDECI